eukprot:SAG31_NODE_418_length_15893_cov_5.433899_5_plen_292_part_00
MVGKVGARPLQSRRALQTFFSFGKAFFPRSASVFCFFSSNVWLSERLFQNSPRFTSHRRVALRCCLWGCVLPLPPPSAVLSMGLRAASASAVCGVVYGDACCLCLRHLRCCLWGCVLPLPPPSALLSMGMRAASASASAVCGVVYGDACCLCLRRLRCCLWGCVLPLPPPSAVLSMGMRAASASAICGVVYGVACCPASAPAICGLPLPLPAHLRHAGTPSGHWRNQSVGEESVPRRHVLAPRLLVDERACLCQIPGSAGAGNAEGRASDWLDPFLSVQVSGMFAGPPKNA